MSELLKLAARCEAATGPDRTLDAEIAVLVDGLGSVATYSPAYLHAVGNSFEDIGKYADIPAFTASIDAAMSLVPEGAWWWVEAQPLGKAFHAGCADECVATAATPALALCIAALRARDSGRHSESEDASAAEGEACQSGPKGIAQ